MFKGPRKGTKDDKAHPPIHPVKLAEASDFKTANEEKIYTFLVKHFLASLSADAIGEETKITLAVGDEKFKAQGLTIVEPNYLKIYDKWAAEKMIPKSLTKKGAKVKIS